MKTHSSTHRIELIQWIFYFLVTGITVGLLATPYYLYAILPGIGIFLLLLLGKFPTIGYYIIIVLIPFYAIRGNLPWVIALWIVLIVSFKFLFQKKLTVRLQSQLWPWLLFFLLINFISTLVSDYSQYTIRNVSLLLSAYIFFAISMILLSQKDFLVILPIVLISSVSLSALSGILGYAFGLSFFQTPDVAGTFAYERQPTGGGAVDYNVLGLMINFNMPLMVHKFFRIPRFQTKMLFGILIIVNFIALVITYSRGSAVVFAIVICLIIIFNAGKVKPIYLGFIVLIASTIVVLVIALMPSSYWERQKSMTDTVGDASVGRRFSYYKVAFDAFKKHPFIGTGTETFREHFAKSDYARIYERREEDIIALKRDAHNTYLEHLVGSGSLGLIVFLIILWKTFKSYQSAYKQFRLRGDNEMASMVRTYQISFISVVCYLGILSEPYQKYFLLSLALAQIAWRLSRETKEGQYNGNIIPAEYSVV
jgi:O-antigen ligase